MAQINIETTDNLPTLRTKLNSNFTDIYTGGAGTEGPAGADGAPGADGATGLSAYEVALANGFIGTEAEWLESLAGKDYVQYVFYDAGWPVSRPTDVDTVVAVGGTIAPTWLTSTDVWQEDVS